MKYCEELGALLDLYVDGELSPRESARVRAHLEGCPGCRAYVEDALVIRAALADMAEAEPPEGFAENVMNAVRKSGTAPSPARRGGRPENRRNWGKALLPLAACAAIVLLLRCVPAESGRDELNAAAPAAPESAPEAGIVQYALTAGDAAEDTGTPAETPQEAAPEPGGAAPSMARVGGEETEAAYFGAVPQSDGNMPAPPEASPASGGAASPAAYTNGAADKDTCDSGRMIRLTSAQAGDLLEDVPYTTGENGIRCYRLTGEAFDTLLKALAERNVEPEEEPAGEPADTSGGGLVYVEEAP